MMRPDPDAGPDPMGEAHPIRAEGVSVRYGPVPALEAVDLTAEAGSIVGLIGPNGAGKSTLVHVLADLVRPHAGSVHIVGLTYDTTAAIARIRRESGFLLSGDALFEYLTGREFLDFLVDSFGLGAEGAGHGRALCARLGLDPYLDRLTSGYSRGNRKKLAIVGALIHQPSVLVLDEPFESLDPLGVRALRGLLQENAARGASVLVASHDLAEMERICDRIVLIDHGRVQVAGTLEEITERVRRPGVGLTLEALYQQVVSGPREDA